MPISSTISVRTGVNNVLHHEIDATTEANRQAAVNPEQNKHGIDQPSSGFAWRRAVLCDVHEDDAKAYERRWNEHRFCRMCDGIQKC